MTRPGPFGRVQVDVRTPTYLGGSEEVRVSSEKGGVIARCSVSRGRSLSPGIQQSPFYWRDVVHGPPPRRRERGDCIHVSHHGMDDNPDVRLAFTTLIRVDPGMDKERVDDDIVHVEERLNVQRRPLQEFVDRERAFTERVCLRMRSRLAHRLVAQRRLATRIQTAWIVTTLLVLIRVQAKVGNAGIRGFRAVMRGLVAVPDALLTHTTNVSIHLGSRYGRKILRRAIRDPASATPQEKTLALVVGTLSLAGVILFLDLLFTTFLTPYAPTFAAIQLDFLKSLAAVIALPFPVEILLITSVLAVGSVLAFTGLYLGKLVGSWMLYLLGDSLFDGINKKAKTRPRLAKSIGWLQRNANKHGLWMLFLINAVPFVPDLLIIVFAVSGMKFRNYMLGIGLGTAVKFLGLIIAVNLVGPDAIRAFMEHPIQTMRGG